MDMLITSAIRTEADPDVANSETLVTVKGAVFNFRNNLLPVDFVVKTNEGMEYFEGLGATQGNPVFTKVWGRIYCGSNKQEVKEETAFGEEAVRTYERKIRQWVITGTSKVPYDFEDETVLTSAEVTKAAQDRELMLADTKKRSDDYRAQKEATGAATSSSQSTSPVSVATGTFNF
jgi:hypothetical protein